MDVVLTVSISSTNGLNIAFPSTWKCLTFHNCDYWKPATAVYWSNLPYYTFAAFYETTTCYAGGESVYYSAPLVPTGSHAFLPPMPIRSMMIGVNRNYTRRPSVIYYNGCRLDDYRGDIENIIRGEVIDDETMETAANSSDQRSGDGASADWGLSPNWTAPLPE
ncbi:hypothetical protein F444_09816 [Phytophthora nicotianae P1976]|uniref:Uncharacterized protein n=1 Tax=Phytophthora nicotianae P1976 TaxID=1317066 RepID=A0A081A6G4_PHYNI|nr:hypothetical protein F444_09816 [Phytophthora nicotianae P1976]